MSGPVSITAEYIGWIIAVAMGIVNLIIGYLVIPTKAKLEKLNEAFSECRRCSAEHRTRMTESDKHQNEAIKRSDSTISEMAKCMGQMKIALVRIEENQRTLADNQNGLVDKVNRILERLED